MTRAPETVTSVVGWMNPVNCVQVAWNCEELMSTVSPANKGDVSTWMTAAIADELVSTTSVGSICTVMGSGAVPPVPVPPVLLQVWVLWQPALILAEATPEVPIRGRAVASATVRDCGLWSDLQGS
jgi:hypothetical protein